MNFGNTPNTNTNSSYNNTNSSYNGPISNGSTGNSTLTPTNGNVAPPTLTGGKRRVVKRNTKPAVKKEQSKPKENSKKNVQGKASLKSKKEKKGGSFVTDVQNLAVPFAILLAKEGLSKVFKKDDKKTSSLSPKTAKRPSSLRRKSTLAGGSCNLGCGAMTGGRAARELFTLQKEIDNFLEKY